MLGKNTRLGWGSGLGSGIEMVTTWPISWSRLSRYSGMVSKFAGTANSSSSCALTRDSLHRSQLVLSQRISRESTTQAGTHVSQVRDVAYV